MIEAVFFDLDGTLADTAPDLVAALNRLRDEEGLPPLPLTQLRPFASHGVRGLLGAGLNLRPGDPVYADFASRFLDHYDQALCVHTVLFPGVEELLKGLEDGGLKWGVVTNKTSHFTHRLLEALKLARRAHCLVSGDSAPRSKPHPAPLLLAAEITGTACERCLYVGDDLRDIRAAAAAGMRSIAAGYGYLGEDQPIDAWGADAIVRAPEEIVERLGGRGERAW